MHSCAHARMDGNLSGFSDAARARPPSPHYHAIQSVDSAAADWISHRDAAGRGFGGWRRMEGGRRC